MVVLWVEVVSLGVFSGALLHEVVQSKAALTRVIVVLHGR